MLQLYPGRRLEPGQVAAIVHLVASSVPELAASDVTLVDQAGNLAQFTRRKFRPGCEHPPISSTRARSRKAISGASSKCSKPMVGPGRVARKRSRPTWIFTVTEETHENYDPQKTAVRSEQTSNEQRKGGRRCGRHSGRPQQSTAGHFRCAGDSGRRHTRESRGRRRRAIDRRRQRPEFERAAQQPANFEVDRTLSYVKQARGCFETAQCRRRARRFGRKWMPTARSTTGAHERHTDIKALHAAGARIHRAQGGSRRPLERAQTKPSRAACRWVPSTARRCGKRPGSLSWRSKSWVARWCW